MSLTAFFLKNIMPFGKNNNVFYSKGEL